MIVMCITFSSYAQFNSDAPWMPQQSEADRQANPLTLNEISDAFNAYWEDKDPTVKGSGYKPFKRWEYHWSFYVDSEGNFPSRQQLWNGWEEHQSRVNNTQADLSAWQAVGPFSHTNTGSWSSGQGRVNAITVDPSNANTWYIGAPAGGIWKSTDAGVNWTPLSDNLPQIGVSGIAVDPNNPQIIYIATGDDDAGDTNSVGVFKSIDGGTTWQVTGLNVSNSPSRMSEIYSHPTLSNVLWVATNGGLYKTTDSGTTWTRTITGDVRDLKLKPGDPDTVYIVRSRRVYKSTNGGDLNTFQQIATNLPAPQAIGRLLIEVTPKNSEYLYVLGSASNNSYLGLYKSTDSGATFTQTQNTANIFESTQAWFDLALTVSHDDENEVYVGCLNVWKSTNGGDNFTKLNNWNNPSGASYTHADIHVLRFFGNRLFCGSDGGIYSSTNNGTNFTDHTSTAAISQFYRVAVAKNNASKMVGGLQDNGGHALNNGQWQNYYGADGMDTAIDPNSDNIYYGFIQNGGTLYISNTSGAGITSSVNGPQNGNWVTPLVVNSTGDVYAGYTNLYRLVGTSWTQVSPAFTSRIDHIEIDPRNDNTIYVAVDNRLFFSFNGGQTFSLGYTFTSNITSIEINHSNSNTVYITLSGTGNNKVWKSANGGVSFTNISSNLPTNLTYFKIIHQDRHSQNPLYVGTSVGVYRLDDTSTNWEPFANGLPNVPVRDLEISLDDEKITAATYGRGIWQSTIQVERPPVDARLAGFDNIVENTFICGNVTPELRVQNLGATTINSISVTYTVDGGAAQNFTWNGTLASATATNIPIPGLSLSPGDHTIDATINTTGDTYATNNQYNTSFTSNRAGVVEVVNDFEQASDELITTSNSINTWQRGIPSGTTLGAASADGSAYGTIIGGNYPNNTTATLVSECYDLTGLQNPKVKFDMAFNIENLWDILYMEYSTNEGGTWTLLGDAGPNWYNNSDPAGGNCVNCVGGQWTGTDAAFAQKTSYEYDLTALGSESSVLFRFVFRSDTSQSFNGAVIDNFVIEGAPLSVDEFTTSAIAVYPNPSQGIFNIQWDINVSKMDIAVYDVSGKQIINATNVRTSDRNYKLDLSNVKTGVYFMKVRSDKGEVNKKLIVR